MGACCSNNQTVGAEATEFNKPEAPNGALLQS